MYVQRMIYNKGKSCKSWMKMKVFYLEKIYTSAGAIASKNPLPLPDLDKLGTSCLDELSAGFKHMTQSITCPLLRQKEPSKLSCGVYP